MEGPGARILAERLKPLVGASADFLFQGRSVRRKIDEVCVQGKRIYIGTADGYLSIFFGMYGSLKTESHGLEGVSLTIVSGDSRLAFRRCSIRWISKSAFQNLYDQRIDVTSESFDSGLVLKFIESADPERLVCDVLLDQNIFAGSGNIIKNEALFRSGISPRRKLESICYGEREKLISETRIFSLMFLDAIKSGIPVKSITQIYRKNSCRYCGSKVKREKMGETNRLTFYCESCQL
ncbi:MAG TPA: hypothetical protein VKU79_00970 [Thermoplasmataceae archaeon]|nr:hypothetical protein [Thermoplasmataceae archaeon]